MATSTQYTYSFYVKQKQSTWIGLTLAGFTTPTTTTAYFDLANGVQGSQATATAADAIRMEKCRDDWYRCSITFTTDAADTTGSVRVYVADGDGDFTVDRDGTSDLYIWGAQLETGSRPTSYIHTVGSSVTRARDDIGKDLAELPFADAAPGTFVFAGEVEDASRTQYTWTMNDSSHDNRYTQFFSSGNINNYIADGGAAQHNASVGAGRDGANFKASLAWDTNDAQGCLNGVLNTQDTSVVLPSGLNILELGQWGAGGASNQMSGVMSYCKFLTRRVPNAGLQTDTEVSYSGLEGASTLKLANSLREETDVAVWNWKQMRVHIKDTSTPGNNKNTVAITDEIVDYASPSVKRVTGPDRLLKYAAQNVIQYSEDLSNAYWTKNAFASTAQNAVTRPDGTLTGQRISLSALAAGQQRFFNSMTVPSGRVRVYVELKLSSDKTWAYIRLNNTTAAHHVWYNLRTGVLGTTQGSVHVGDITSLGDDWYGCEIVTDGSGAAGNLVVGVSDSDNVTTSTSVGGETVDIGKLIVQQHPAQDIYLKTTTVARYAIPCDHDAATYTTSTTAATLALGTLTLTTADSAEFTAGQDICGSDQSDPHGKYWTGTVTSHSGTTLVVNVDHFEGSGSVSSWHLIKIEGVLVEPAATNLQPYSQEFSNAVYTKTVTVTDNTDTAPDGTTTADTIEDDNAAGFENLVDANTIPDDSLDYTFSIFVLKDSDETRFPELRLALQGGTSQYRYFQFNTATGATSSTGSAGTSTYTVEDYGLYWRVIVTVTNNSSGNTSALWTLYPAISMSLGSGSNLAATGSIIIWGAQLEQSSVPTSYIHTPSTASVTRAADDLSQATSEFAFKDGQAGSHIMSVNIRDASSQVHAVNYNDGSAANRVLMYTSSSSIRGYMDAASVNQANASAGALSDNTDHKIGVVWGAGRLIAARDENLSAEDTSVTLLSGVTGVNFGASEAHVAQINGHVKYDVYRPRDLSNADLQLETT
ncbi:hypothetical protein [uncultured Paraglaciecola sp.]|uniref:phage head spike fiber domain-containing protein n=1 Tax=uncultured Paraglaciecola sp. TaxID=1765024 RepID=UPI0026213A4F|nr:hypothetical protein [uncultured Paraglaciecola sp.]